MFGVPPRLADLRAGDMLLIADDGFDCVERWTPVSVHFDTDYGFWVPCDDGRHYLDGQVRGDRPGGDPRDLVGLTWAGPTLHLKAGDVAAALAMGVLLCSMFGAAASVLGGAILGMLVLSRGFGRVSL